LKRTVVSFSVIEFPAGATRFAFSSAKARAQTIAPSGLVEKLSAFLETPERLCDYRNRNPQPCHSDEGGISITLVFCEDSSFVGMTILSFAF